MTVGLKGKFIFGFCILILGSLFVVGALSQWQSSRMGKAHALALAHNEVDYLSNDILSRLETAKESLLTLYGVPPIAALMRARNADGVDPKSGDSLEQWQQRLQIIFSAFLQQGNKLQQLRYIDETGFERVRVENIQGAIHNVPAAELQNKGQRDYFIQSMQLDAGQIYIGDMTLNREHGRISEPREAVLRMAIPLFDAAGHRRGILIANVRGAYLLASLMKDQGGSQNYVLNAHGYFLQHPDSSRLFGFEYGREASFADEFPALVPALLEPADRYQRSDDRHLIEAFEKIYFDAGDHSHYWVLLHTVPEAALLKDVTVARNTLLLVSLVISVCILLLVSFIVTRRIMQPLTRLVTAADALQQGDLSIRLPVDQAKDEFRTLYQMVNAFVEKQKRAHEELQSEVEERTATLSNIMDSMADGLITINAQGRVQSFNRAAEHIFGYAAAEVTGQDVSMLMPEALHSEYDEPIKPASQKDRARTLQREVIGHRKDGSAFPVELCISKMRSGKHYSFVGTVRDISERKQAADELAAKNLELRIRSDYDKSYAEELAIISSTYDREKAINEMLSILARNHTFPVSAIYLSDVQHDRLACVASHGAPTSLKQYIHFGEGLIGQAAKEGRMQMLDKLSDEGGLSIEAGILSFTPVALVASPILYDAKVMGVLVLATSEALTELDIHFIERLSSQLGVAFNNFGQYIHLQEVTEQLRQQSEEIQRKNCELESANRMKSEFLANMSHELRTPLNAIIGFSEIIKDGAAGELNDDQSDYIQEIFDSGHHLLALINEILDLSKIEAGRMELDLCEVIVPDLLENSLSIIREQALKHGLSLHTDIAEDVGCCMLDMRKAKQILYNLLSNAVKFTPDGGSVTLRARIVRGKEAIRSQTSGGNNEVFASHLTSHTLADDDCLEISVSDTGIGIAKADLERIFMPFEKVDGSMSRRYQGTGLGLILVKSMVELHGGGVSVESEPDKGSTFTVRIPYRQTDCEAEEPIQPCHAAPAVHHEPESAQMASDERPLALIVEDDYGTAEVMRLNLETNGLQSQRAATAEGALHWLVTHKPDLIVLDLMLPLINGLDFLAILKKHNHGSDIPVIVASSAADENKQKAYSLGAAAVLQKPVDIKTLAGALTELGFARDME